LDGPLTADGSSAAEFRAELINPRRSRELRRSVLRPHLATSDPLPGDGIGTAVHIGAFVNIFTLASTCFIYPDPCPWRAAEQPAWHLRSLATEPALRGQGAATAVLRTAVDYVAATGGGLLWCDARLAAITFYLRIGWTEHGDEHLSSDPPIPHRYLWRMVEPSPPVSLD
jgi:GNAT superfamily N-acetyltransferase